VASTVLHLFKESVEYNLLNFLPDIGSGPVSASAFSQARYKVKGDFFRDLHEMVSEWAGSRGPTPTWKGYALYAGDGSTENLPPTKAIKEHFGVESTTKYGVDRCLAKIFMVYSVLDKFVHDAELHLRRRGEKTMLTDSLDRMPLKEGSVLLLDRGFGNLCVAKHLRKKGLEFCIRLSTGLSNFAKEMMENPLDDFVTEWAPSEKSKENLRKNNLDYEPLTVRVTKIKLDSGETELLVSTLLDKTEVSHRDMAELYHLRWGVEEGFKNLKPKMKLGYFGCGKPEGIQQEFYAHIFCMNLVSLTGSIAETVIRGKTKKRKLSYTYNWKNAYRVVRDRIGGLLYLSGRKAEELLEEICRLISKSTIAIKPDRNFPRDLRDSAISGRLCPMNK